MAWPALAAEENLSGKGAKVIGQGMYDRSQAAANRYTTWYFAEASVPGILTTMDTQRIRIPPWGLSGETITLNVWATFGAGSGNIKVQLNETDTATSGTLTAVTLTSTYAFYAAAVTIPDNTWASTLKTLEIQSIIDGAGSARVISGAGVFGNFGVSGS